LKTFAAFNVYGMSAITSVTAQNTVGVRAIYDIPPEMVRRQIEAVMEDIGVNAAKTGMLSNSNIIETVADKIGKYHLEKLVTDPVMVAKSGSPLLEEEAKATLIKTLLPLVYIITPNIFEAEIISGISIKSIKDAEKAATLIYEKGPKNVLMKGGHLSTRKAIDILFDGNEYHYYESERIDTKNTHGTGCTLSAAITAGLAKGFDVRHAIEIAKDYINRAIKDAPLNIGKGHGPLFHNLKPISL
ncbi:bifunctional hydroxymethylpyrimidine kinase/phosphomethylpyrimidine kinase, partial [bacterium]|nr:bifunctional hydroxymethylpyrimidine kinase/phosphomethylpyrimidine kinase [bacterium]